MDITEREQMVELYKSKILGIRLYKAEKQDFDTNDFIDLKKLAHFLNEVETSESDITPAGVSFLERYYGFEDLAKKLVEKGYPPEAAVNKTWNEKIVEYIRWFNSLAPMEILTFVEKARGNLSDDPKLNEKLLPPEDTKS